MYNNLKRRILNTNEKKRLVGNIISLGTLQGINYILPLLTMPYLVRVLGPEYFGLLAFANATIGYFMLVTDYGFNLSATRQISINREDRNKVIQIFSSVMTIKALLLIISFVVMAILVVSFEKFSDHREIYFLAFGMVIGQMLLPSWLFQGMEKMRNIAFLNIFAKTIFTLCIFIFVDEQADYLLVPFFNSLGFIIAGVLSLFLVRKEFSVCFRWQAVPELKCQFVEGWHVFSFNIWKGMYTVSVTFILGIFTNNSVVGYFSAAERIIQAVKGLYQPVSQAIFPLVGKKLQDDKATGLAFIGKISWMIGIAMFIVSLLLFVFARPIVEILLGNQYFQSILFVQVLAILPFVIFLSNMLGVQTMLNLGYHEEIRRILSTAAILSVLLSMVVVPLYGGLGSSVIVVAIEVFITFAMWISLTKKLKDE